MTKVGDVQLGDGDTRLSIHPDRAHFFFTMLREDIRPLGEKKIVIEAQKTVYSHVAIGAYVNPLWVDLYGRSYRLVEGGR